MKLSECTIGTLVIDRDSPRFVGHVVGYTYNPVSGMVVDVKWPNINHFDLERVKKTERDVAWIQLGIEVSSIHPSRLMKYVD